MTSFTFCLLAQQSNPWQILATRVVFFVIGLIMVGVGFYAIKTKQLLMGRKQKRFLRLFGKEEITGRWAVIGGVVQLLIGLVLAALPVAGPYLGVLAMNEDKKPGPSRIRTPRPEFNAFDSDEEEEDYEEPGPLDVASIPIPPLSLDDEFILTAATFGRPSAIGRNDETAERGVEGGVIVGVQLTKGARRFDADYKSLQFIYQVDDRYEPGQIMGEPQERVYRELAEPGFVVGGMHLDLFAGKIQSLQLVYYKMSDNHIAADAERVVSKRYGDDPMGRGDEIIDVRQPIVGFSMEHRRGRIEALQLEFVDTDLQRLIATQPLAMDPLTYPEGLKEHQLRIWRRYEGGIEYEDQAPAGGVLIGLRCLVPNEDRGIIQGLQPIYQTADKLSVGPVAASSPAGTTPHAELAKPGYALAGWTFSGNAHAIKLTFMKLNGSRLDPSDSYESDWIGTERQTNSDEMPPHWQSEGDLVIGIKLRTSGTQVAYPTLLTGCSTRRGARSTGRNRTAQRQPV